MNWKKGILFGIAIWVALFIFMFVLTFFFETLNSIISLVVITVFVFFASKIIKPENYIQAFKYGLLWAIIGILLDILVYGAISSGLFLDVYYWLGYTIMIVLPVFSKYINFYKNQNIVK